jgi:oligoribonuclease NrnB/cAMP/cGMP phosphodiesterase (DHH superfamily)
MTEVGKTMTRYRDGYTEGCRNTFGFETKFHELNCYALNMGRMGSSMFGDKMNTYDACLSFYYDGVRWTVSIYSAKGSIDCAAICKEHGGGGHRGAAGFTADVLPFKKSQQETI